MVSAAQELEQHYRDSFDRLVKRYAQRAGSFQDAEDIVQHAYYRALLYLDSYNGKDFQCWFGRILTNTLRTTKSSTSGYIFEEFEEGKHEAMLSSGIDAQTLDEIEQLISEKEEHHSEVLYLFFFQGHPVREIVQITDLKYKTVEQIIQRFKKELKAKYGKRVDV